MMDKNELEEKVFDLIELKDFHELSPVEQELVLSILEKEEYDAHRQMLVDSTEAMESEKEFLIPDLSIHESLKKQIHQTSKPKGIWALLASAMEFRLPIYQPALAFTTILLGIWFLLPPTTSEIKYVVQEKMVYQPQIDTITVEKIVEVPVVREREIVKYVYQKPTSDIQIEFDAESNDNMAIGAYSPEEKPTLDELESTFGNTSIEQEDLAQFRTGL